MQVEKDKHGTIWIVQPEPFRVASIERDDTSDVWSITISKNTFKFWFSLVISPENTEEKVIQIAKDIMLFSQFGVYFQ